MTHRTAGAHGTLEINLYNVSCRMKKVLAILRVVLLVSSVASAEVSAVLFIIRLYSQYF